MMARRYFTILSLDGSLNHSDAPKYKIQFKSKLAAVCSESWMCIETIECVCKLQKEQ